MLKSILNLPRIYKQIIAITIDVISIILAYLGALAIRLNFESVWQYSDYNYALLPVIAITILVFIKIGLYRSILRYASVEVFKTIIIGVTISTVTLLISSFYLHLNLPRSIPFLYFIFAVSLITLSRFTFRLFINSTQHGRIPVIIYGAGESGRQLMQALQTSSSYKINAFVDDDNKLHKTVIHGIPVFSPTQIKELISRYRIKKILLAIPSVSIGRRKEIIISLSQYPCEILTIPGMLDIISGKAELTTLKRISIDDLLGRDTIEPINTLLAQNITNKVVMVTGAGGSIGSELCRQIIKNQPQAIVLFELSEFSLYNIHKELSEFKLENNLTLELIPLLGSVQQKNRLLQVMQTFTVNTIYHAAAYKHVPLVEYNMVEGVQNNIFGTLCCAEAAIEAKVETFVLISTDKAVRPTNTMGATKRMAELVLQALAEQQTHTRFCMVRFGNVLGSSGSVVPLFEKQIAAGGPITLTHPEIMRYFMTIPEASQLVIQAGAMGNGGEVFVLDMGESVKIIELAKRMIGLTGLSIKDEHNPQGDIEIKITGLRPGEKLYEELLIGKAINGTSHPRIMMAQETMLDWQELSQILTELEQACDNFDLTKIRHLLISAPTDFNPVDSICDIVWNEM